MLFQVKKLTSSSTFSFSRSIALESFVPSAQITPERPARSCSLVPPALHHAVPLPAGRRQRHRPREHDGHRRLDVSLQEVEDDVPPRPRQVVVWSLTQRLSRDKHTGELVTGS